MLSQLSGPVSLSYLTPTHPDLPLVMLLGDVHESDENRCEPCSAPSCYPVESLDFLEMLDELAETYPIDFYTESDPSFLESNQGHAPTRNVLFQYLLRNTVKYCHDVPTRVSPRYLKQCPTSYLRWHFIDVRQFPHMIEGYTYQPLRYLLDVTTQTYRTHYKLKKSERGELLFSSLAQILRDNPFLFQSIPNIELREAAMPFNIELLHKYSEWKEENNASEETAVVLCHFFHCFKNSISAISRHLNEEIPNQPMAKQFQEHLRSRAPQLAPYEAPLYHLIWNIFLEKTPHRPTTFKSKEELQAFFVRIADVIFTIITFIEEQFRAYFDFISTTRESALWKQYQKQTLPFLRDPSYWVVLFCRDIILHPAYLAPFVLIYYYNTYFPVDAFYPFIERLLSSKKRTLFPPPFEYAIEPRPHTPDCVSKRDGTHILLQLSIAISSAMIFMSKSNLDIYLLLRMLKSPGKGIFKEEGVRPALVIAYLGDNHSRHIRELLLSPLFGYQDKQSVMLSSHNGSPSRCVSLPEPIDLCDDLEKHVASLPEWSNQRNRYQRRRAEENKKRGTVRQRKTRNGKTVCNRNRNHNVNKA